jgi:molybdate transport system permease protein
MLGLLVLPLASLLGASTPQDIAAGLQHPLFGPALWLSTWTSVVSLLLILLTGTPLAWWLASSRGRMVRVIDLMVALPVVLPPAVVGIALLHSLGRTAFIGSHLALLGVQLPFTSAAVVVAQVTVAAPFYIQAAAAAFRGVDRELMLVARSLGQTRMGAIFRVLVPLALPGLAGGAALAWARALGEFGATLLFAGNLTGTTQTMPLAIYMAMETDVRAALALALVLASLSVLLLFALQLLPSVFGHPRTNGGNGGDSV